jgi:hypothetical protein
MKVLAVTSCLAILFVVNSSAIGQARRTEVTTFQLGNQLTVIPAPDGFEEAASQFELIKEHFSRTEVPENDMLAVHLSRAECDKLRAGESATFNFYTKVSVRKDIRDQDYSAERFAELVALFRKTGSQVLDVNSPTMKGAVQQLDKGLSEIKQERNKSRSESTG